MKAHAEKIKPPLCVKTPEAVERTGDGASSLIEKNAPGVTQANLVSNVENDVNMSAGNHPVIGCWRSPRIGPDCPIALDKPPQ